MRIAGTTLTGPDALTILRVPLACALVAMGSHRGAALGIFIAGVATDIIDGWWARRTGTSSERGARLDSIADAVFVAATVFVVVTTVALPLSMALATSVGVIAATRVASLIVTRLRLHTWAIMHTDLNRTSGAALAVAAAVGISRGELSLTALLAVAAITQLAAAEEFAIASTTRSYDPDNRGLLRETIARVIR